MSKRGGSGTDLRQAKLSRGQDGEIVVTGQNGSTSPLSMDKKTLCVCLTGGPCAGKSTALSMLRTRLLSLGYHVVVVPENATNVFGNIGGYNPEWATDRVRHCRLQRTLLEFQLDQEKHFRNLAQLYNQDCVVLHDRGALDVKAFMRPLEWEKMLLEMGKTERQLRDESYDVVIHMVTAALGAREHYEFGPGSRNPERFHNAEEAADCDKLGLQAYTGHPNLVIVDNSTDFPEKVERVLGVIMKSLGKPLPSRHRRRFFIESIADADIPVPFHAVDLRVTYLSSPNDKTTTTVRRRGQRGVFNYSLRQVFGSTEDTSDTAESEGLGEKGVVTEAQITEAQYAQLISTAEDGKKEVCKRLRYLTYNYRYFVLNDYVEPKSDKTILDCEVESSDTQLELPPFIKVVSQEDIAAKHDEELIHCYTQMVAARSLSVLR